MAKKQETSSKKPKTAPKTKSKPAKRDSGATPAEAPAATKKRTATAATNSQPELTSEAIGAAAGQLWSVLAERGGQPMAALKKLVDSPEDHVVMAIGWLAREDKLAFETKGRTVTVSLR